MLDQPKPVQLLDDALGKPERVQVRQRQIGQIAPLELPQVDQLAYRQVAHLHHAGHPVPLQQARVDDLGLGHCIGTDLAQRPYVVVVDNAEIDQMVQFDRRIRQQSVQIDNRARPDKPTVRRDIREKRRRFRGDVRGKQLVDGHLGRPDQVLPRQVPEVHQPGLDKRRDIQLLKLQIRQSDQGVAYKVLQAHQGRFDQAL